MSRDELSIIQEIIAEEMDLNPQDITEEMTLDEDLDMDIYNRSINAIENADTMIVAGTSLTVYPAAGLVRYFQGDNLILINRDATPLDNRADLVIHGSVGEILSNIDIK